MKVLSFFSALLLVGFSVGEVCADAPSGSAKTTGKLDAFELGRYQSCGSDKDCIVVNNGCCDCANGGEDVAISKDRLQDFKNRFDCMEIMCTQMAKEPPCGSGLVSCINHKCKYVEAVE